MVHVEHVGRLGESFGVLRRVLNVAVARAYHVLLSCTLLGNAHYARLDGRRRRSRSFCRRVIGSRGDLGKSNCRPQCGAGVRFARRRAACVAVNPRNLRGLYSD